MRKTIFTRAKKFFWLGLVVVLIATFLLGRNSAADDDDDDDDGTAASSAEDGIEPQIWTCPMHPQIQEAEPGACPICHMDLVPADDVDAGAEIEAVQLSEDAQRLAGVQHATVQREPLTVQLDVFGTIDVSEDDEVDLTAWTGGRIEELAVSAVGETVEEGQLLARIYSPDLLEAQRSLLQAHDIARSAREAGSDRRLRAAESSIRGARERLRLLGVDQRQIEAIERGGQARETVDVHATASGTIRARHVSEGDYVDEGGRLFSLAALDSVWAQLEIPERDLMKVDDGAPVTIDASSAGTEEMEGRISFVSPQVDERRRVAFARVPLPNEDGDLRPGMYVSATIEAGGDAEEVLTVPRSAVLWTGPRSLVYHYDDDLDPPGYVAREVDLGPRVGDHYVVDEGLDEGDVIAERGVFRIDSELQIAGGSSMMAADRSAEAVKTVDDADQEFLSALQELLSFYDGISAHLVHDTTDGIAEDAEALRDEALGTADDAPESLATHIEALAEHADELTEVTADADIEEVRLTFGELSREMVAITAALPSVGDDLYLYECPMAEGYQKWLQFEEQMANPYMGQEMLQCGFEVS